MRPDIVGHLIDPAGRGQKGTAGTAGKEAAKGATVIGEEDELLALRVLLESVAIFWACPSTILKRLWLWLWGPGLSPHPTHHFRTHTPTTQKGRLHKKKTEGKKWPPD